MKLLSLNTAGRLKKISDQINEIVSINCDVICLQEVIQSTKKIFYEKLPEYGYEWIVDNSFEELSDHKGPRKYCLITASRIKLSKLKIISPVGWNEKLLRTSIVSGNKRIELFNIQLPPGVSNGIRKIYTAREIYRNLELSKNSYKILCGDFNTPQKEFPDGKIMTWGERFRKNGEIYIKNDEKNSGERLLLKGINDLGLYDDFRRIHGYKSEEYSWFHKWRSGITKRRYDHIYSTKELGLKDCYYLHNFRKNGLSDHSGMVSEYIVQ